MTERCSGLVTNSVLDGVTFQKSNTDHRYYDQIFTDSRRELWNDPEWRQGPERAFEVSSQVIDIFKKYTSDIDKSYLEIGCGKYSPLGVSTVLYLNGVRNAIAFDVNGADNKRAAEALYDLLAACALEPKRWNLYGQDHKIFFERLHSFNVQALKNGDLQTGILDTNITYVIGNLENTPLADNSVSLISSRATLEHVTDFAKGMNELYRITQPGGISFHSIDLVDHRTYKEPDKFNRWSFLLEGDDFSDGLCNRLRINKILDIVEKIGFTVNVIKTDRTEIPEGIRARLDKKYKEISLEELEITSVACIFIKR